MTQIVQLERIPRNKPLPLTDDQYRLWFLHQLDPDSIHFNINMPFCISGELQEELFEESLNAIVRRHEVLRTVFQVLNKEPEQVIFDELRLTIPKTDLRTLPEADREREAVRLMNEAMKQPFSLEKGPLLRAHFYQLSDEERIVLFTIHHIVADFDSLGKIVREIGFYYSAFVQGDNAELPPLPVQFADYAYYQKTRMQGDLYQKQLKYWKEKLAGDIPLLRMPFDRPRPAVMTHNGANLRIRISPEVTAGLREVSRKNGVTLFITLLSAYQTLLLHYTGQEDICVGTPITARNRPEMQEMIGMMINTLVLRTNLGGNPLFPELLKLNRKTAFGAFAHQDIPYEKLVDGLQKERDLSHNMFFQTMLMHLNGAADEAREVAGVTIRPYEFQKKTSTFEMTFSISEMKDEMMGSMDYNTDLFNKDTIERFLGHFLNLLQAIAENPNRPIMELPIMSEEEKRTILEKWSGKNNVRPLPEQSVHELFTAQAAHTPDAVAVRHLDRQYTYRELDELSNQVANYLLNKGIGSNKLVGICIDRSLEMVVGLLGILKSGSAYVPIDPSYPPERILYMIENSQVEVLLTSDTVAKSVQQANCNAIPFDTQWETITQESKELRAAVSNQEDLMYVIYTSGSTGKPKGVMVSHRGVVNHCLNIIDRFQLSAESRVLQFTSVSFDVAVQEIFPTLLSGAALVLWKDKYLADGGEFLQWINEEKITVLNLTTAHWSNLVTDLKNGSAQLPESLKVVIVGGEKVSYETFLTWSKLTAGKVRWINDYGLTETTITATMFEPEANWEPTRIIPIGTPLDNVEIYILNAQQQPVPFGVYGELYIGGAGIAKGYWGRPELTEERFVLHPFSSEPTDLVYKTGDQARFLPDGNVEFLGRQDHQIKVRGYRIELGEIEAVLEQYGKLSQLAVIPRQAANGSTHLAAYIVLSEPTVQIEELKNFMKSRLPDYMVPTYFVVMDEIPLTVNGKVDKEALPQPNYTIKTKEFVAPRTPSEEIALNLWSTLLDNQEIGVLDNFFEIGGNSLLATQVISQAKTAFGCNITLRVLFENPVLADWVEQIEQIKLLESTGAATADEKCMVKIQQKGDQRPLFVVHPVGGTISCYFSLAKQLGANQPLYALQSHAMVCKTSTLDTVEKMADHYIHEILEVQPEGPYRLGGWSMGGFIAYEIARKLTEAGQQVEQLVLIDSYLSKTTHADDDTIMFNFIRQLAAVPGNAISISIMASWKSLNLDHEGMCRELISLGLLPEGTSPEEVQHLIDVYKTTVYAFKKYMPEERPLLDIPNVQLFRAEDSHEEEGVWTRLVTKLSLYHVVADHFSIVHNQDVGRLIDEAYASYSCVPKEG